MAKKENRLPFGKRLLFTGFFLCLLFLFVEICARLVCLLPNVNPPRKMCRFENASKEREFTYVQRKLDKKKSHYSYDIYSPSLGWTVKPNFSEMAVKPGVATYWVQTNSKGVRSDREIPYERDPDRFRVLVLGASQTFGEGVSNGECFSDLLEKRLEGTEWINLAVHGYANDQMLITLDEEGRKYKPDLILLGFHPSVIYRNTLSFRSFAKPMFVLEDGKLKLTHVPVPTPEEVLERNRLHPVQPDCSSLKNLSYIYRFFHAAWKRAMLERIKILEGSSFLRAIYPTAKKIIKSFMKESPTSKKFILQGKEWRVTQAIFRKIQDIAEEEGAQLLLVLYPGSTEEFEEEVHRFAAEEGISFCNISPPYREVMKKEGPGHFALMDGGHWNPRGHEMAADAIEVCLREKFLTGKNREVSEK